MLKAYRRHRKQCRHSRAARSRELLRCDCPVWVDGRLKGERVHRSLGATDWQKGQQIVRDLEAEGTVLVPQREAEPVTIETAWTRFLTDIEVRKLHPSTIRKYRLLKRQMMEFAEAKKLNLLARFTTETLDDLRATWKDGALSASKKLERLRSFFRFATKRKWVQENPASDLRPPKIPAHPTLPYTREEMLRILAAIDKYRSLFANRGAENALRMRGLVLLLRYSGVRISDAVSLTTEKLQGNRLFLRCAKTGVPVNTILPDFVLAALALTPKVNEKHFFWDGTSNLETIVGSWRRRMVKLFELAEVEQGHPHRFRDTFAVELLLSGVPIERVSILLGHQSVRVTEKHYAPWVRARQEQLEADLARAWSTDPVILSESKVTRRLREKSQLPN